MNSRVAQWIKRIDDEEEWYPGRPLTDEELVVRYIMRLEDRIRELEDFQNNVMWERDIRNGGVM